MNKRRRLPKDQMIKSVMDDLKNVAKEPSIQLEPIETNIVEIPDDLMEEPGTGRTAPEGLLKTSHIDSTVVLPKDKNIPVPSSSGDKTTMVDPKTGQPIEEPVVVQKPVQKNIPEEDISEKTFVAAARPRPIEKSADPKPIFGVQKPSLKASAFEAQFLQAENLKIAQQRIIELEKDMERLRKENEILSSAGELSKQKNEDLLAKVQNLERQKFELKETNESELRIFKEGLNSKESEVQRLRQKIDELESRLANDLRKIRVRERELENRLELSKLEKTALVRSKDENILELKRRLDGVNAEIESYQHRIVDLNKRIQENQDQFSRTVRALRIALTNLEVNENTSSSITLAPLKKAD